MLVLHTYPALLRISPYSVRMRENTDQKNSEYGHFSSHTGFKSEKVLSRNYPFYTMDPMVPRSKLAVKSAGPRNPSSSTTVRLLVVPT